MSLIMLIIQIITAIPTIIKLIHQIVIFIDGLKGQEKVAAQKDLATILKRHLKTHDAAAAEKDLVEFHQGLVNKYQ